MNQRVQTMAHLAQALAPEDVALIKVALQEYRHRYDGTDAGNRAGELAELARSVNLSRDALGPAGRAPVLTEAEWQLAYYLVTASGEDDAVAHQLTAKLQA